MTANNRRTENQYSQQYSRLPRLEGIGLVQCGKRFGQSIGIERNHSDIHLDISQDLRPCVIARMKLDPQ